MNVGRGNKIIVRSGKWKTVHTTVLPAVVHYETDSTSEFLPYEFDSLERLYTDRIKILVLKGKKSYAFIWNKDLKLIMPEDTVNGIHIVHINNLKTFINDYKLYNENNVYNI